VLSAAVEQDPCFSVVGTEDDVSAGNVLDRLVPDLVLVSAELGHPSMYDFIRHVARECALPVLVVADPVQSSEVEFAFRALRCGALDIVTVTDAEGGACTGLLPSARGMLDLASNCDLRSIDAGYRSLLGARGPCGSSPEVRPLMVGIAAGAGAYADFVTILRSLRSDFDGCLLLAHQLSSGFEGPFAAFLQEGTHLRVVLSGECRELCAGTLVVAQGGAGLILEAPFGLAPSNGGLPPRETADALFLSLADHWGSAGLGIVLSGAGVQGSVGLLQMRRSGALTIAQSKDSARCPGMPRAALERGAALRVLPPAEIGNLLHGAAAERDARRNSHAGAGLSRALLEV
jgi:two-component system chemotaxis response regulator CheB